MVHRDEDALVCDFAETYHILNWRALPLDLAARLASGLGSDSRIMRALTGQTAATDDIFLAAILDRCSFLVWAQTEDAKKGKNRPESVLSKLLGVEDKHHTRGTSFANGEEFEKAKMRLLQKARGCADG